MKVKKSKDKYVVYVDDNFNFMDESERYRSGEFDTPEEAILKCKRIVDDSLDDPSAQNAKELYDSYTMFGDDPFIVGPTKVEFSAWDYARQRCEEIFPTKPNSATGGQ